MHAVGIRDLKNRLSEYLRLVKAGERILVTDRGEVVAELGPPGEGALQQDLPPRLREMIRRGVVKPAAPRDNHRVPEFPRIAPDGTAQRLIDEERGTR